MQIRIKKTCYSLLIFLLTTAFSAVHAQEQSWETFLKEKDSALMEVTVNMELYFARPNYKNVLIVGTKTDHCYKNGFPKPQGLNDFYTFSDSLAFKLSKLTKHRLAGIITYQCTGFDVYYVKDTINLRNKLDTILLKNFAGKKNYVFLERDKRWAYFAENLLPSDLSNDFFVNHEYLIPFVQNGDDLSTPRTVKHWFNFKNTRRRTKFIDKVKVLNFSIDSVTYKKEKEYPYEVILSRKDYVLPKQISNLTKLLSMLSQRYYGIYDGWETEEILDD